MKVQTGKTKEFFKKGTMSCLCEPERQGILPGEDNVKKTCSGDDWGDIFDTLTDMVTVHDSNFNIIGANAAAKKALGLLPNAGNAKCYEYYHGTERPPAGCPGCRCLNTGRPANFEIYEPHLKMYIEIRVIPRYGGDNRPTGMVHVVRDITRRKKVEEELEIHRHHLEWLVKQRTAEISFTNEQLRREIAERERVEAETERVIRELKDLLRTSSNP